MIFYICGPITGKPDDNKPAFAEAERIIDETDHLSLNPHKICRGVVMLHQGTPQELWVKCMRKDIAAMLQADAVVRLPGWEQSRGAMLELQIASKLNIPVYTMDQFRKLFTQSANESVDHSRA